jgi:hypothetical protein
MIKKTSIFAPFVASSTRVKKWNGDHFYPKTTPSASKLNASTLSAGADRWAACIRLLQAVVYDSFNQRIRLRPPAGPPPSFERQSGVQGGAEKMLR